LKSTIRILSLLLLTACSADTAIHISPDPSRKIPASHNNLIYRYTIPSGTTRYRDLFNHIYFEGDTAGFHTTLGKLNRGGAITAYYINADETVRVHAERLEIEQNRAWGFSLVGTLLEHFHKDKLDQKLPDRIPSIEMPCKLEIAVPGEPIRTREFRIVCTFSEGKP
jgi:hypothetical protein